MSNMYDDKMNGRRENITLLKFLFNILKVLITVILLFFALIVIIQRVTNNDGSFLGFRIFRVETGSMIPKYEVGDVILVKEKNIEKIDVGEDLVYVGNYGQVNGRIITHQLIRIEKDENGNKLFYTKGIANNSEDPAVSPSQIRGTVVRKIVVLSFLFDLLYDPFAPYFLIVIPVTIYIAFSYIHKARRREQRERRGNNK